MNSNSIVTAGQFQLQVPCYRLWLSVGWTDAEREIPQPIDIELSISLAAAPSASKTDSLADTFCYASLLDALAKASQVRSFKLLECLAEILLGITEQFLQDKGYRAAIAVGVTKVCPPISGVLSGIRVLRSNALLPAGAPCPSQ